MRNLKKFLALVLAMVMAFSLMVTANASHAGTQYGDEADVTPAFSEAVEVLTGMGIFQGDNGDFRPASNITRAEVAAIIYRLATGDTGTAKMDLYTTRHPFTDVRSDAWYAGYVGYLYNAKIIKGTTATTFNPAGNVTGYEVLAMILRAIGYDKNDEFTGSTWTVEVASTATTLKILQDVDSTHYGDTLHLASRRDVVASMLFRAAAYVPMVQYTLAFGYQDTGMEGGVTGSTKNPTLGWRNFGLAYKTGIVVGNQATGERFTKISYKMQNWWDTNGTTPTLTDADFADVGYSYEVNAVDTAGAQYGALTLDYSFNTGLDFFGHKVNVWYNGKAHSDTVTYSDAGAGGIDFYNLFATYAVVDKANRVKTVFADNALLDNNGVGDTVNLLDAAQANGFSGANKSWTAAYMSDRYSQFSTARQRTDTIKSKVGMYKLISNSSDLDVDVAIVLNQEVAKINQVNSTIKNGEYIYLGKGASNFGTQLASLGTAGEIMFSQLSSTSVKTLGTVVTAHQIVGTNDTAKVAGNTAVSRAYTVGSGNTTATAPACWYQTDKLESGLTGTIATYKLAGSDTDGDSGKLNVTAITLTDGTVLNLSGITGSQEPFGFDGYCHLIDGVTKLTDKNTAAGVTYTFYFDEVGRFIGVGIPNDYSFLYTTFADYQIGNLGTGTIGYYVYGVDWDGNIVKDKQITSITLPVPVAAGPFTETVAAPGITYPNAALSAPLSMGYGLLPVTMKNQGAIVYGNEIAEGANTRFVVDPAGNLNWYNVGGQYGTRFVGYDDANVGGVAGIGPGTANTYTWEITSQDVVNGFKRVYNIGNVAGGAGTQNAYLLTNTTKFIVVTGSGTANLDVKTYNGIGELVDSGTSAEIEVFWDGTSNKLVGDSVYFLTSSDKYGNTETNNNATIDTVILSDTNLNNYAAQSLFFSEPGNPATGVKLAGDNTGHVINQYKLYNGGQAGYYWIDETASNGITADGQAVKGDFYQLTPINTINGQPIYKAVKVTDARGAGNNVGAKYDYIVVNDLSTAEITFSDGIKQVFNVSSATVTEAFGTNSISGLFPSGTNTIDSVLKLNHAVSMGKGNGSAGDLYNVSVAIVYSGVNMVDIYVTNIQ